MKTFHERLTEHENERHAKRVADISSMQAALALAEPTIQKLEARLNLELRLDQRLHGLALSDYLPLRLAASVYTLTDNKMHEVLTALGFTEVDRVSYSLFDEVIVVKDGLAITLSTLPRRAEKKAPIDPLPCRRHNDSQVTA